MDDYVWNEPFVPAAAANGVTTACFADNLNYDGIGIAHSCGKRAI